LTTVRAFLPYNCHFEVFFTFPFADPHGTPADSAAAFVNLRLWHTPQIIRFRYDPA
jgi:hypothetical protein